jgi:hypothetical protein
MEEGTDVSPAPREQKHMLRFLTGISQHAKGAAISYHDSYINLKVGRARAAILFRHAQDYFPLEMTRFASLVCFACLSQRHDRIDGNAQVSSINQLTYLGQLDPTGLQHVTLACPNGDTSFSSVFTRKVAQGYWDKCAAPLERCKQAMVLAASGVKDDINIMSNLFYGGNGIINEFIDAQFAQKGRVTPRCRPDDTCSFQLRQLNSEVTNASRSSSVAWRERCSSSSRQWTRSCNRLFSARRWSSSSFLFTLPLYLMHYSSATAWPS